MFSSAHFDELAKKLSSILPSSMHDVEKEIALKFKEILRVAFDRMDLVTREEFDVQCKVLARTREKLDDIQQQLTQLVQQNNLDKK